MKLDSRREFVFVDSKNLAVLKMSEREIGRYVDKKFEGKHGKRDEWLKGI